MSNTGELTIACYIRDIHGLYTGGVLRTFATLGTGIDRIIATIYFPAQECQYQLITIFNSNRLHDGKWCGGWLKTRSIELSSLHHTRARTSNRVQI